MDGSTSTSVSPSVNNQGIGRISDKRKTSVSWKIKIQLAIASAAATPYQRCHSVWARCASFMTLFSEPRRFGSASLFSMQCPVVVEEDSKSCCKTPLGNMAVSTAWQISRGLATSSTTGLWDVLCHILSRAEEEMMRECDIYHTRSIKTNSAVNLSRKPGLDLCCDLLQHLQGVTVPRTCSFYIIIRTSLLLVPSSLKLSSIWNVTRSNSRIICMAYFAQFCFIMFNM